MRMGRLATLLLIALMGGSALSGCTRTAEKKTETQQFVFQSLNLRQSDDKGRPAWSLISPEASYDLERKIAQVKQPRGVIYAKGKPLYNISATSGTVINDGEVIQLEGKVKIQAVGSKPSVISGDRLRWIPSRQRISIDRRPMLVDRSSRLTADTALFLLDQDKLELRGRTRLVNATIDLRVAQADWFAASGVLKAPGPVRGIRRLKNKQEQTLTASALEGNTRTEVIDALAPVRFVDPSQDAVFNGQRTRWDSTRQRLSTALPFVGQIGNLEVRGQSLELQLNEKWALIPAGCDLRQPAERLTANDCLYNWADQTVRARGNVVFRREANQQVTRSEVLNGKVAGEGLVIFTTPGGRVKSQLQVPPAKESPAGESPGGRSPRSSPPVTF